jgi:hypothetical protein
MLAARSVRGAYASRVWCSASRRTESSGGTPEIARGDACAPQSYPETVALSALTDSKILHVRSQRQVWR